MATKDSKVMKQVQSFQMCMPRHTQSLRARRERKCCSLPQANILAIRGSSPLRTWSNHDGLLCIQAAGLLPPEFDVVQSRKRVGSFTQPTE